MPKITAALVCATKDEPGLQPVVDGLRAAGRPACLVGGAELEPRRVADALDECGEWGLLVVCGSRHLDPHLRKIEGLFSARRGPHHTMVVVEAAQSARNIVAAIERAAAALTAQHGRAVQRAAVSEPSEARAIGMPVVRLEAEEELDGDTNRIDMPHDPTSVELARRRKVARERESQHAGRGVEVRPEPRDVVAKELDARRLDRMMMAVVVAGGVIAVVVALLVSGVL